MGYLTRHELTVSPPVEALKFSILLDESKLPIPSGEVEIEDIRNVLLGDNDSMKWYGHEKDVAAWATLLPGATFVLSGEGEEQGDVWRLYAKGPLFRKQRPVMSWPEKPVWAEPEENQ
jgi:hypothetical protein